MAESRFSRNGESSNVERIPHACLERVSLMSRARMKCAVAFDMLDPSINIKTQAVATERECVSRGRSVAMDSHLRRFILIDIAERLRRPVRGDIHKMATE